MHVNLGNLDTCILMLMKEDHFQEFYTMKNNFKNYSKG